MAPGPTTPLALGLPSGLEGAGFNAAGVLSASRWDTLVPRDWSAEALLPGAVSALVLATGGTAFFRAFRARGNDLRSLDPIDTFAASVVREATEAIRAEGSRCRSVFYTERRGPLKTSSRP